MPGTNQQMAEGKREGEQEEPSPLKKARSQASALLRSETEETLAAWAQATGEDLSSDKYDRIRLAQGEERATGSKAATQAAAAAEHIQEALQLARHSPTWSGSTPLSRSHQPQLSSGWRTAAQAQCLRAFEIAALVTGAQGELAEVMELVQSGQALLCGSKRSSNWQRTHMTAHPADVLSLQGGASEQVPRQTRFSERDAGFVRYYPSWKKKRGALQTRRCKNWMHGRPSTGGPKKWWK